MEFGRVVPPSGNMEVLGKQSWLGTARSGLTVRFWASADQPVRSIKAHRSRKAAHVS